MIVEDNKPHILVLNSSEDLLILAKELLEDAGYRVSLDRKVGETPDDVVAISPDLVILDFLWINDDSGWKFLQLMKLDPRTSSIPVVLCTAGVREAEELRPNLEKMNVKIVFKPFDIDILLDAVREQLEANHREYAESPRYSERSEETSGQSGAYPRTSVD